MPLFGPKPKTLPANVARRPNRPPNPEAVLQRRGILPQQRTAHPALSRLFYESAGPMDLQYYASGDERRSNAALLAEGATGLFNRLRHGPRFVDPVDAPQEDAFRMYTGQPQTHGTFHVSRYRPTRARDPHAVYYSDPGLHDDLDVRGLYDDARKAGGPVVADLNDTGRHGSALGHATFDSGQDERGRPYLSVYDKWDIDAPGASVVGKPFEVYDRFYLDETPPLAHPHSHPMAMPEGQESSPDAAAWPATGGSAGQSAASPMALLRAYFNKPRR